MPTYEFRCRQCGTEFATFYKSVAAYNAAAPTCPHCAAESLDRIINRISFAAMSRAYAALSSDEMLSVLESGDTRQVRELYQQVGGTSPEAAVGHHEQAQKLQGASSDTSVE